jgi:hypothetical protein
MTRNAFSFFAGSALTALAAYVAGGGMRAGLLIGFSLALIALVCWPRSISRGLLAFSEALEAFWSHWQGQQPVAAAKRPRGSNAQELPNLTPVQAEVESALMNLGMSKGKARVTASRATAEDFESAFRQVA